MNENSYVKVKTPWGLTENVNTENILKQGGVLSLLLYGVLTDDIAKTLIKEGKLIIIV